MSPCLLMSGCRHSFVVLKPVKSWPPKCHLRSASTEGLWTLHAELYHEHPPSHIPPTPTHAPTFTYTPHTPTHAWTPTLTYTSHTNACMLFWRGTVMGVGGWLGRDLLYKCPEYQILSVVCFILGNVRCLVIQMAGTVTTNLSRFRLDSFLSCLTQTTHNMSRRPDEYRGNMNKNGLISATKNLKNVFRAAQFSCTRVINLFNGDCSEITNLSCTSKGRVQGNYQKKLC